ncbi:MAG: PIN domain-containing protein [Alphaproteobacteria bacterium]|nr:PIN domain-containing protein [Alphaproteobacteria bacterium]
MDRAVFDTDVIIHYAKDMESAVKIITDCPERYISFTTWIEFLVGFRVSEQARCRAFLQNNFDIIPCDHRIAEFVIHLRQTAKLKYPDATIYATAKYLRAPLVTFNTKDFDAALPDIVVPYT